jgi:hypothetical protein
MTVERHCAIRSSFLDGAQRRTRNPDTGTVRVSGFRVRAFSAPRNDHVFNCQTAWASIIARIFSGAGYAVTSFVPRKHEGDGAPGGATIVRSGPCKARPGAVRKTPRWRAMRRPRLPLLPPWLRVLGEAHGGRSAPESQAPGGGLIVAAGRSSRHRPGAGETSSPGRGRRIRSHPHDAS